MKGVGFTRGWLRLAAALLVLALNTGSGGCAARRARPPNIILVVVDTLRPDALGSYGAVSPTPHMDAIAAEGVRFTRAVAQAPWTIPSLASLITSRYPLEHGQGAQAGQASASFPTLAQRLKAVGYRTAAFLELSSPLFREGFETFEVPVGDTEHRFRNAVLSGPSPTFARAIDWLRGDSRPFFLMIHTYEAHDYFLGRPRHREYASARHPDYRGPFSRWRPRPPSEAVGNQLFDELLEASEADIAFVRSLYEGAVQVVDEEVGRLDAALVKLGLRDGTIVVVTSDHGEGFSPRLRRVLHGGRLHEDLLHIPLIVRWPGRIPAAVERARVQSIDIAPTLLRLAGLPELQASNAAGETSMRGGSLLEQEQGIARYFFGNRFVAAPDPRRAAFAEESAFLVLPSGQRERSAKHQVALYAGDHKLVRVGGREELFDLANDPLEGSNIVATQPKVASEMRRRLDRLLRDLGNGGGGPREDIEEALRALGYIR